MRSRLATLPEEDRVEIEALARSSSFESLVYNDDAYQELAELIQQVAQVLAADEVPVAEARRQALSLIVEEQLVPDIAYEFVKRFGSPEATPPA